MRASNLKTWATGLCVLTLWAPIVVAQQQPTDNPNPNQSGPIPAYHSPLAGAADNSEADENSQNLAPDTHSLSGAQLLTLGIPTTRTYWQPSFTYLGTADSNPVVAQGNGNTWTGWSTVTGTIDVHRTSGNNTLDLTYVGGGTIPVGGPGGSGVLQELSAVDGIAFRRWNLSLIEQLSYLPPSALGVNGIGGIGIGGAGGIGTPILNPGLGPGQGILTASGQSLSSASDGEADVRLTPRTSLTFVGGYILLNYFDDSMLNYGGFNARAGYNYQWTRKDTLAVVYTYNRYNYTNYKQSIDSQAVQLSYARRVTGRLAFQAAAGPQFASFFQPIPSGGTAPTSSGTQLYWSANASLQYQLKRGSLGVGYSHGVNGGSGVLAGGIADSVTGSVSRRITPTVNVSINSGYNRNRGVAVATTPPATMAQTYSYWSAGGNLSRSWGPSLSLNLSYQMQYQASGAEFCVGVTCGTSYFRNLISVGVSWRERPLLF